MVEAYFEDLKQCDPREPIYLFDLGAGMGRLGYLILKQLMPQFEICYVMTDIVEQNIQFWQKHPQLQEFIEKGILDFAYYHHAQKDPIQLINRGITLEQTRNPVVVIATYFFDTVPHDLFRVQDGQLQEGRITLYIPPEIPDEMDPKWVKEMMHEYTYVPIEKPEGYYSRLPQLNAILKTYTETLENAPFLFPIGSFETIQYFSNLSNDRLLILAGDQGVCTKEQVQKWGEPTINRHASFSFGVNFHALGQFIENRGGFALNTSFTNGMFNSVCYVIGGERHLYRSTVSMFHNRFETLESVDYMVLTHLQSEQINAHTLSQLLILIKLGQYDAATLYTFINAISQKIIRATSEEIQ